MNHFDIWIIKLENRVSKLRYNSRFDYAESSEKELNKCHALLMQIYNHAILQKTSIADYRPRINLVQDELIEIQENIENKKKTIWNVSKNKILKVVVVIAKILNLGDWSDLLDNDKPKLLT